MLSIRLDKICDFTSATPSSRNMIEGQKLINSNMIVMCGVSARTDKSVELYSLCLQTSALTSNPHTITGKLKIVKDCNIVVEEDDGTELFIEKMTCSCKAGNSEACKHIVAVLLYCNRNDINSLIRISSTDRACIWNKCKGPVLHQFEAQPTKYFCCINQERLKTLTDVQQKDIRRRLISCDEKTALSKHYHRNLENISDGSEDIQNENNSREISQNNIRVPFSSIENTRNNVSTLSSNENNVPVAELNFIDLVINRVDSSTSLDFLKSVNVQLLDCCSNFYNERIVCTDIRKLEKLTKENAITWKEERKYRITGSRCYGLYTYSKDDWPTKACKYFWEKGFTNKYVRHGIQFESVAREMYTRETNSFVQECGLLVCKNHPWIAYSPDGVAIKRNKIDRLIEIKCPFDLQNTSIEELKIKCKFLCIKDSEITLRRRHKYFAQVQWGMAVLNLSSCDFIVYSNISNSILIISIIYDVKFVKELFITLKKRYFEKMLHEVCKNSRM